MTDHLPLYGFLFENYWISSIFVVFLIGLIIAVLFRYLSILKIGNLPIVKSLFVFYSGELIFGEGIASNVHHIFIYIFFPMIIAYFINLMTKKII